MPEPWFLYVAFNAAHGPLNLPPEALVPSGLPADDAPNEDRFDAVLEALDTEIGRLLDSLDPAVLASTTVLAIGDNGTSDAGVPDAVDLGRNKHTPYEGGIRVPFIVTGPHVTQPGRDWVYAEAVGNGPPPYNLDRRAVQTATHKLVRWNGADELYRLEGPHAWDHTVLETFTAADTAALEELTAILDAAPDTWAYEGR